MERHPGDALADPVGDERLDPGLGAVLGAEHPDPLPVLDAALGGVAGVDLDEHVLLQLGEPVVRARLLAAALVFDEAAGGEDDREVAGRCSCRPPPSAPRSRCSAAGTAARRAASDTSPRGPAAASRSARGGPGSGPAGSRRSPAPCRCRSGSTPCSRQTRWMPPERSIAQLTASTLLPPMRWMIGAAPPA